MLYVLLLALVLGVVLYLFRAGTFAQRPKKLTRSQENAQLIKVLLELDDERRQQLFELYKAQFGSGAARYAQQTYLKWKLGSVRPNKQTFRRFLINLPQVMDFDLKCEVLRELREAYCAQDNYQLTVSTDNWKARLTPLVDDILRKVQISDLPESLKRRLVWLSEDNMTVANAILAESQARQTATALRLLEKEFSNIEQLLDNAKGVSKVTHLLRLPLGTVTLQIKKGSGNG